MCVYIIITLVTGTILVPFIYLFNCSTKLGPKVIDHAKGPFTKP